MPIFHHQCQTMQLARKGKKPSKSFENSLKIVNIRLFFRNKLYGISLVNAQLLVTSKLRPGLKVFFFHHLAQPLVPRVQKMTIHKLHLTDIIICSDIL